MGGRVACACAGVCQRGGATLTVLQVVVDSHQLHAPELRQTAHSHALMLVYPQRLGRGQRGGRGEAQQCLVAAPVVPVVHPHQQAVAPPLGRHGVPGAVPQWPLQHTGLPRLPASP